MTMTVVPARLNEAKDKLVIIDQTLLPNEEKWLELDKAEDIWEAIKKLRVRGAPVSYTHLDVYKRQVLLWENIM